MANISTGIAESQLLPAQLVCYVAVNLIRKCRIFKNLYFKERAGPGEEAKPNRSMVFACNGKGKEAVAINHHDPKISKGCFLLYDYKNGMYTFNKKVVEKAVN